MRILKSEEYFDTDIELKIFDQEHQSDLEVHSHEFSELIFFVEGSGSHLIDDYQKVILPNTVSFVSPNHYHQYANSHQVRLFNVLYNKDTLGLRPHCIETLNSLESSSMHRHFEPECFNQLVNLVKQIQAELNNREKHSLDIIKLLFEQLIYLIDRNNLSVEDRSPVIDAIRYISEHYKEHDLNIGYVCNKFEINSRTLSNKINQLTGLSTNKFLNQLRICKAISLIEKGHSITEVSYMVGYNDSNYFSTKFKSVTGKSPSHYIVD
ncbi:MAG: helix-turn-helix domain-containing protein [Vibrio sp.]